MLEIGWTEIIVAIVGLFTADAGVVFWVVKYFLDRQAKAGANKTKVEAEHDAISNASEALGMYKNIQALIGEQVKEQVKVAVEPVERQLKKQTEAYNHLSVKFQAVLDELEQWGCYRGQKKSAGPDCDMRLPKAVADKLPDDDVYETPSAKKGQP